MGSGRVPEKGPGEYRERVESGRVLKSGQVLKRWDPGEYREGKIWVSTRNGGIRVRCWRTQNKLNEVNKLREKGWALV